MKRSKLSIILATVILFSTILCLMSQPKYRKIVFANEPLLKNSKILYTQYNIREDLPVGLHLALNNAELKQLEEELGVCLSSEFANHEGYQNDNYTYFIQIYEPFGETNNILPTGFNISKHKASFEYTPTGELGLVSTCEIIPSKVAVAAIPNDLMEEICVPCTTDFEDENGTTWELVANRM